MKIAYVHSMQFPSQEANTFDSVWTASALSRVVDTTLFIRESSISKRKIKKYYNIQGTPLKIKSMHLNLIPDRELMKIPYHYEKALSYYLRINPFWLTQNDIRHPKGLLYWGIARLNQSWLKSWKLVYEAHDPLGIDPDQFGDQNPFDLINGREGNRHQEILKAVKNFDVVICNSKSLADDIQAWTNGEVNTHPILIGSNLPRLDHSPNINGFIGKVVLGYIGTIDRQRGVDILLEALKLLPNKFILRLVGRLRDEVGVDPHWLQQYLNDPKLANRIELKIENPISDVVQEIDQCDILIQTASSDLQYARYGVPLKAFCYMNRGKPIIVGDVPCFHEFFHNGENALYYHLDPRSLANSVLYLVNHPKFAEKIARGALEQSEKYALSHRVDKILALVG